MKFRILTTMIILLCVIGFAQNLPKVTSGNIKRIENFQSKFVVARNVDVWMPEGYELSKKYSVVYMHDGQMLFDSTQTWNKKEWGVDETFSRLMKEEKIERCIVVAIWNTGGNRISEYFPNKIFSQLENKTQTMFTRFVRLGNYIRIVQEMIK